MLKGIGKQVVIIKNPNSKLFEEAIFIIKDGAYTAESSNLLTECERIIRLGNKYNESIKKKRNRWLILSTCVASWSFGLIAIIMLTIQML